jgi:fructokinase
MFTTLSFGEVLWDVFPGYKKPGGSPANLAYHLHCLGNRSLLLSRVGNDDPGRELLSFLEGRGLDLTLIQTDNHLPTGEVTVTFSDNEPSYTIHQPSAWDAIEITDLLYKELKGVDAVCFASLSQRDDRSAIAINKILEAIPENCLKIFDLNLRPPFISKEAIIRQIHVSDIVKLNEEEYATVSEWFDTNKLAEKLLSEAPSKTVLVTKGAEGSMMHTSGGIYIEKAHPVSGNGDFVGVGDAFLACFTHLRLMKTPDTDILKLANKYAAYVASQKGGMPNMHSSQIESITRG